MPTDEQRNELAAEIAAFEALRSELLKHHEEKFALVKDGQLQGTFTTEREAYEAGVKSFGPSTFLVRQVAKENQVAAMPALFAGLIHAGI